jgi:hypothetical protein
MQSLRVFALSLLSLLVLVTTAPAHDVTLPAENWVKSYSGEVPACSDPEVLRTIQYRFIQRETGFWNSDLRIDHIDRVGQVALRPWGADFIPRRFCQARAFLNNDRRHTLTYSIIEDGSIMGITWGVQWCVVGLDRNMHFAPECRAARP